MSQIILNNSGSSPGGSLQFTTSDSTVAVPVDNTINIFGAQTAANNEFGITTTADPDNLIPALSPDAGDTVYIALTNRKTGNVTTGTAAVVDIVLLEMPATPASFYIYGYIVVFCTTNNAGAAYSFTGGYKTDGMTATEIGIEFHDQFEESSLEPSDIFVDAFDNFVRVRVQGVNGLSINWNCLIQYRQVQ